MYFKRGKHEWDFFIFLKSCHDVCTDDGPNGFNERNQRGKREEVYKYWESEHQNKGPELIS